MCCFATQPLWRGGKLGLDQWLGYGKAGNTEIVIGGRTVGEEKKEDYEVMNIDPGR